MATKHKWLNEAEIEATTFDGELGRHLATMAAAGCKGPILDWGCGRGRSVIRLRDRGFQAWGIDVDPKVLEQSRPALVHRGLEGQGILRLLEDENDFVDGYFQLIFSEETLEHVQDLETMARRTFALTAPGGWGIHSFPGSRRWMEPHLHLPFIHWLHKGALQEWYIELALARGWTPPSPWPETQGLSDHHGKAQIYAGYLREKTHYRDIEAVVRIFRTAGFEATYRHQGHLPLWRHLAPTSWKNNGFPSANLVLILHRSSNGAGVPAP